MNISLRAVFTWNTLLLSSQMNHPEIVSHLLKSGANVNAKCDGFTALHNACNKGHGDVVKILLENGDDVELKNFPIFGETAEQLLKETGLDDIVNLIK